MEAPTRARGSLLYKTEQVGRMQPQVVESTASMFLQCDSQLISLYH